jgi:hypothetical protein
MENKIPNNVVDLEIGQVVFGRWKNKDQNKAFFKALQDKDIVNIKDADSKEKAILKVTQDWLLAYSIWNGNGVLKGSSLEETYEHIQNLDIIDATNLGKAFNDYATEMAEHLKKK